MRTKNTSGVQSLVPFSLLVGAWALLALTGITAEPPTNAPAGDFLFYNNLGNVVRVSTNDVHSSFHPSTSLGMDRQIPTPTPGMPQSDHVRKRIADSKTGSETLQWFAATPPVLAPYLGSFDEYGNTAVQQGALFATDPISRGAQAAKYWISDFGLRNIFYQSLAMVRMPDAISGDSTLEYYFATFYGKWSVFETPNGGPAGWLSVEANAQVGLSAASREQSPQNNLGALVNPQANVSGPNGVWLSELAWQQSFCEGSFVLVAGQLNQANYLDVNAYANNSQSQFLNGAFVNNSVIPLPSNNLGANLQWQPADSWYVLFGTSANNQTPGQSPFQDLGFNNWSYLLELGLTPTNLFGWGPGAYRLQPFVATVDGSTQAGVALNIQQQLGPNSPFACFGRFGVGGSQIMLHSAQAQASVGMVMDSPMAHLGIAPRLTNDSLGCAFVWSQAVAAEEAYHENEYAGEIFYALQLTPTVRLQPDVQVVWNAAFNPEPGPALVWQLQLNIAW
ncbi:MAG TPA: carbohydrate porin [Verrucomicrobiota bacterium]|nr:hypothetical protein [Verrucomicrobiales bacterium]HRI12828.1 carbohydrate porin [Verrucomicrobiota bacterium]